MLNLIIKKIIGSLKYSVNGIYFTWTNEMSFKLEIILIGIFIFLLFFHPFPFLLKLLLLTQAILVIILEIINTAIEKTIDAMEQYNALLKVAKDCGSASVFLMISLFILTWISSIIVYGF